MFGVGCFWLETTIIIKIESHPFYPMICPWFWWGWSKKKSKWPTQKNEIFKTTNSQKNFAKLSRISPWVYWINWRERHFFATSPSKSGKIVNFILLLHTLPILVYDVERPASLVFPAFLCQKKVSKQGWQNNLRKSCKAWIIKGPQILNKAQKEPIYLLNGVW